MIIQHSACQVRVKFMVMSKVNKYSIYFLSQPQHTLVDGFDLYLMKLISIATAHN